MYRTPVRGALCHALAFALAGCATSNSAWLREPEAGMSLGDELAAPLANAPTRLETRDVTRQSAETDSSRRRLDRTVTLGEADTSALTGENRAAAAGSAPAVPVIVNNYVTLPAYSPPYDSYFVERSFDRTSGEPARPASRPSTIRPAQDWPAPPSYGPSFPYKTAPASPWR